MIFQRAKIEKNNYGQYRMFIEKIFYGTKFSSMSQKVEF